MPGLPIDWERRGLRPTPPRPENSNDHLPPRSFSSASPVVPFPPPRAPAYARLCLQCDRVFQPPAAAPASASSRATAAGDGTTLVVFCSPLCERRWSLPGDV